MSTINRDLTAFSNLMNAIENDGWIHTTPVQIYEKQGMKEVLPDIVLPTVQGIQKMSARALGTLQYFPNFLDATGGRVTELAMLQWPDIFASEEIARVQADGDNGFR